MSRTFVEFCCDSIDEGGLTNTTGSGSRINIDYAGTYYGFCGLGGAEPNGDAAYVRLELHDAMGALKQTVMALPLGYIAGLSLVGVFVANTGDRLVATYDDSHFVTPPVGERLGCFRIGDVVPIRSCSGDGGDG